MKTIKQLAEDLNVSKTAVRNYLTPEFREAYTQTDARGVIMITDEGEAKLQSLRKGCGNAENNARKDCGNIAESDLCADLVELLKAQLVEKDAQIRAKDEQLAAKDEQLAALTSALESTSSSLTAAQALNAADKQQLLLLQDKQNQPESFGQRLRYLFTGRR